MERLGRIVWYVCSTVLHHLRHAEVNSLVPDAGIVNFYQTKDTLMAHVDRSEVCATSPLVSISYVPSLPHGLQLLNPQPGSAIAPSS